jgi:hypothetical protein
MCGCGGSSRSAQQVPRERLRPQLASGTGRAEGGYVWNGPRRGTVAPPAPAPDAPRR